MADPRDPRSEENWWKRLSEIDTSNREAHDRIMKTVEDVSKRVNEHVLAHTEFDDSVRRFLKTVEKLHAESQRNWLWNALLVAALMFSLMSMYANWQHDAHPYHPTAGQLHRDTEKQLDELKDRLQRLEAASESR